LRARPQVPFKNSWFEQFRQNVDNESALIKVFDKYLDSVGGEVLTLRPDKIFDHVCSSYVGQPDYDKVRDRVTDVIFDDFNLTRLDIQKRKSKGKYTLFSNK
jgi:hypothetical protein